MVAGTTDQQLSIEIGELLGCLRRKLVSNLNGIENTASQRLLRLFEVWRQVSLRRTVDLAGGALSFFEQERLVPACTLTRSVVETAAVQYYIYKKLISYTEKPDVPSIHKLLMSAVFGRRDTEWPQQSIQVLTAIDHLDKQFPGFRSEYDRLCEYAHPNLGGGFGTYVRSEGNEMQSHFGDNPCGLAMGPWGKTELQIALMVATEIDNQLCLFHPRFVAMVNNN
ncbi:MAG: hypothetical protein WA056_00720 [Gallionella sp.]